METKKKGCSTMNQKAMIKQNFILTRLWAATCSSKIRTLASKLKSQICPSVMEATLHLASFTMWTLWRKLLISTKTWHLLWSHQSLTRLEGLLKMLRAHCLCTGIGVGSYLRWKMTTRFLRWPPCTCLLPIYRRTKGRAPLMIWVARQGKVGWISRSLCLP